MPHPVQLRQPYETDQPPSPWYTGFKINCRNQQAPITATTRKRLCVTWHHAWLAAEGNHGDEATPQVMPHFWLGMLRTPSPFQAGCASRWESSRLFRSQLRERKKPFFHVGRCFLGVEGCPDDGPLAFQSGQVLRKNDAVCNEDFRSQPMAT